MSLQTVFDNFALLTEAPNGVDKLRGLILNLAVSGKLATQNPSDGSASILVDAIKKERVRRLGSLKSKDRSGSQEISEAEKFCSVPTQWAWIRLSELGRFTGGATPSTNNSQYWGGDVYWVSPKDMKNGRVYGSELKITDKALNETPLEIIPPKSILIVGRSGILKRVLPVAINHVKCTVNQDLKVIVPFIKGLSEYVQLMLKGFEKFILSELVKGGMTVQSLKYLEFEQQAFPLPPREEQKRIVTKVNELMRLCDELEVQQKAALKTQVRLNSTMLAPLNNAPALTSPEFELASTRLMEMFEGVYQSQETVHCLRSTILQLGIQGKLVEQNHNDQPASALVGKIKKIRGEVTDAKIAKVEEMPPIRGDQMAFQLPVGWRWTRLAEICELITKGSSPKWQGISYVNEGQGVLFVTSENVGSFRLLIENRKFVEARFNELEPRSILKRNDVLMNIVGASIGRAALFDSDEVANINQAVCLIRVVEDSLVPYLLHFLNSETGIQMMLDKQVDNARANLSMGNIAKFPIPLPPLKEQKRIVAKVNHLMALCDELESKLRQAEADSEKLMNAAVQYVLSTVETRPHKELSVRP